MFRFIGKFEFKKAGVGILKEGNSFRYAEPQEIRRMQNLMRTISRLKTNGETDKFNKILERLNVRRPNERTLMELLIHNYENYFRTQNPTGIQKPISDPFRRIYRDGRLINLELGENSDKQIYIKGFDTEVTPKFDVVDFKKRVKPIYQDLLISLDRDVSNLNEDDFNNWLYKNLGNLRHRTPISNIMNALNTNPTSTGVDFIEDIADNIGLSLFLAGERSAEDKNFILPNGIDRKTQNIYNRIYTNPKLRKTIQEKAQNTLDYVNEHLKNENT